MSHRLSQSFQAFTGKAWPAPAAAGRNAALESVARLADPNHSILLRALLDRESIGRAAAPFDGLSAGPSAYAMVAERVQLVREETAFKFLEFRERWRKRLAWIQLGPFLQRNQWVQAIEGGFVLSGKGTRKDSKMLYLQSLHDMASDCERQVSFISGHMFRMQGDLAQETFTERVGKWEKRIHATEESLFRDMAWPWNQPRFRSGFEGFMEAFADLSEALCAVMLAHYEAKWDLFLRGLTPLQTNLLPPAPAQSAPAPALPQ